MSNVVRYISPAISPGATCVQPDCERNIPAGAWCVRLEFKVKVPVLGKVKKEEFACPDCSDRIALDLHTAASEAREMEGRR